MSLKVIRAAGQSERIYWSSRRWMYEIPQTSSMGPTLKPTGNCATDQSGRILTADDRHSIPADEVVDTAVCELLRRWDIHQIRDGMRPIIAKLLERMWLANGEPVPVNEICRHLWGRPAAPTYSTFHTTICKANAAMRLANCPLQLKSRLNQVVFFHS